MSKLDRRSVLLGALGGVTVSGPLGFFSGSLSQQGKASNVVDAPTERPNESYAQNGEDIVVARILDLLGVTKPRYIDIGAHHPSINNNTYLLYKAGGRGVLVEPNPTYAELLRARRPEDTVLEVGIGVTDQKEADYYVIRGDGQLNTFSKEQADELVRRNGPAVLVKVLKRPLVTVNEVLEKHFPGSAPDFVSTDVEGLDFAILKTFDFERFRPKVVCVETAELDGSVHTGILDLMASKGYAVRGGSFVNTIFLDTRAKFAGAADAGRE